MTYHPISRNRRYSAFDRSAGFNYPFGTSFSVPTSILWLYFWFCPMPLLWEQWKRSPLNHLYISFENKIHNFWPCESEEKCVWQWRQWCIQCTSLLMLDGREFVRTVLQAAELRQQRALPDSVPVDIKWNSRRTMATLELIIRTGINTTDTRSLSKSVYWRQSL